MFLTVILFSIVTTLSTELVGVWQDAPNVGSGYSNCYIFYPDGRFRFIYNQMDCDSGEIADEGKYMIKGNKLLLNVLVQHRLQGGSLIESSGSCSSDSTLINATEVLIEGEWPEVLKLGKQTIDQKNNDVPTLKIGGKRYWRISRDPELNMN